MLHTHTSISWMLEVTDCGDPKHACCQLDVLVPKIFPLAFAFAIPTFGYLDIIQTVFCIIKEIDNRMILPKMLNCVLWRNWW